MNGVLPSLVQLGFLGFAVAIMYIASNLIKDAFKAESSTPQALRLKITAVGGYLVLSLAVLGFGIWFALVDPDRSIEVTIGIVPSDDEKLAGVTLHGLLESQAIPNEPSKKRHKISNGSLVMIDIIALTRQFDDLERKLQGLQVVNQSVIGSTLQRPGASAATSDEQGI